ncbi:hypothetical protein ACFRC7_005016, partial [Salmonella enterica]
VAAVIVVCCRGSPGTEAQWNSRHFKQPEINPPSCYYPDYSGPGGMATGPRFLFTVKKTLSHAA